MARSECDQVTNVYTQELKALNSEILGVIKDFEKNTSWTVANIDLLHTLEIGGNREIQTVSSKVIFGS